MTPVRQHTTNFSSAAVLPGSQPREPLRQGLSAQDSLAAAKDQNLWGPVQAPMPRDSSSEALKVANRSNKYFEGTRADLLACSLGEVLPGLLEQVGKPLQKHQAGKKTVVMLEIPNDQSSMRMPTAPSRKGCEGKTPNQALHCQMLKETAPLKRRRTLAVRLPSS